MLDERKLGQANMREAHDDNSNLQKSTSSSLLGSSYHISAMSFGKMLV